DGPELLLQPSAAVTLALVFHELATNAAKYGALSSQNGRVTVRWRRAGTPARPTLALEWAESGGPAVAPPTRQGFGGTMIARVLEHDFGASVQRDFAPGGLRLAVELPLREIAAEPGEGGPDADPAAAPSAGSRADASGRRLLLVEDDALIALDMAERLAALGA